MSEDLQSSKRKYDLEHSEGDVCWSQSGGWKDKKSTQHCLHSYS